MSQMNILRYDPPALGYPWLVVVLDENMEVLRAVAASSPLEAEALVTKLGMGLSKFAK